VLLTARVLQGVGGALMLPGGTLIKSTARQLNAAVSTPPTVGPSAPVSFALLREGPTYLGATISQAVAAMSEMGLGLIFPLLLILNLEMNPALAGLALIPTTCRWWSWPPWSGAGTTGGRPSAAGRRLRVPRGRRGPVGVRRADPELSLAAARLESRRGRPVRCWSAERSWWWARWSRATW
jgi:hypothetical protein